MGVTESVQSTVSLAMVRGTVLGQRLRVSSEGTALVWDAVSVANVIVLVRYVVHLETVSVKSTRSLIKEMVLIKSTMSLLTMTMLVRAPYLW